MSFSCFLAFLPNIVCVTNSVFRVLYDFYDGNVRNYCNDYLQTDCMSEIRVLNEKHTVGQYFGIHEGICASLSYT